MKTDASRRSTGFTLLELIVVITIIGILGTLVVVRVTGFVGKAQSTKIKTDLQAIVEAAEMYYLDTGSYPESLEELRSGQTADGGRASVKIEKTNDPWGQEYYFEMRDGKPMAYCLGKDNVEGGEGEDEDFYYPEQDTGF